MTRYTLVTNYKDWVLDLHDELKARELLTHGHPATIIANCVVGWWGAYEISYFRALADEIVPPAKPLEIPKSDPRIESNPYRQGFNELQALQERVKVLDAEIEASTDAILNQIGDVCLNLLPDHVHYLNAYASELGFPQFHNVGELLVMLGEDHAKVRQRQEGA